MIAIAVPAGRRVGVLCESHLELGVGEIVPFTQIGQLLRFNPKGQIVSITDMLARQSAVQALIEALGSRSVA